MAKVADEDLQRLLESRYDLDAVKKPDLLTSEAIFQAAVSDTAGTFGVTRSKLLAAVTLVAKESDETDSSRSETANARDYAVDQMLFVRDTARDTWLKHDPDHPLRAADCELRQRRFDRLFNYNVADLRQLGPEAVLSRLEPLAEQAHADTDFGALGVSVRLDTAKSRLAVGIEGLKRETGDDRRSSAVLKAARVEHDRASRSHALQVETILVRTDRQDEIGLFLKSRDAAYAARRRTRASISTEPGIETIDAETKVAPQDQDPTISA